MLIVGATLLASLPLLSPGIPNTHDGLFHFYRAMALSEAVCEGCALPRWLPDFAFGYGQPVFAFYGASSYYQALSFLLVGLQPEAALKASTALASLLSGMGVYAVSRRLLRGWPAALAGAAYVLFPYRLANVYVRGAFAEHWALALLPLLLLLGERALTRRDRASWALAAVAWAVLIFTHNLSALVFAPIWALYLVAASWAPGRGWTGAGLRPCLRALLALAAGALLVAFYWLPILPEARLVGLGNTFSTDAWSRYLTSAGETVSRSLVYRYFPDQGVAHGYPLGLVAVVLLGVALTVLVASRRWRGHPRLWFFVGVAGLCWGLQWQGSAPVWDAIPALGFVQFPWRLLGPFGLCWAVLLGLGWQAASERVRLGGLALALGAAALTGLLAVTSLGALPRRSVETTSIRWVQHMWDHDAAIGQVGATWTAEYVPVWVTVDRSAMPWDPVETDRPPEYVLPEGLQVHVLEAGLNSMRLFVESPAPVRLSRHVFYYPGQTVSVDGVEVTAEPFTDLGLVSAIVPEGRHEVRFDFEATPAVWLGRVVAALIAGGLALQVAGGREATSAILALATAALMVVGTTCTAAPKPVRPLWAAYEGKMALAGWQAPDHVRPGEAVPVELFWMPLRTPQENLKVFVHLEAEDGRVIAQSDGDPVGGYTRTSRMVGGEISSDRRWLEVPEETPEGTYALYAGLYRWPEVANLRVTEGQQVGAERVMVGLIEVRR
ncbi:MAG: hypothetical protein HPY83_04025 [Anaerolineae bacterium]|nr:hypothetical protein [Anaerolineae bacterium]